MIKKIFILSIISFLTLEFSSVFAYNGKIAFDLDETLIESDKLDRDALDLAERLGFEIKKSAKGQDYIVRPGAFELLDFAVSQGFTLIIMTHNRPEYAQDILKSSGLNKYFSEVRSMKDYQEVYNLDFNTYPYHRNKIHKSNKSAFNSYLETFYNGFVLNSLKRFQGNANIHPFLPCINCDKYPPLYGARVLFDNSDYNIENAIDFAGVKVSPFYADAIEDRVSDQGDFLWVDSIKNDLRYLKDHEWYEYYEIKFDRKPIVEEVELVK